MKVLVTGGAGYIGSHTVVELLNANHSVVVLDNLINSKAEVIGRLKKITGKDLVFYKVDLRNQGELEKVFAEHRLEAVFHFAGLKAVSESIDDPLRYYSTNLISTLNLCQQMRKSGVNKLIFSSSATVYGKPSELPLKETSRSGVNITNPYGQTKHQIEVILRDLVAASNEFKVAILRYFNPIGAHESGLIGEDPNGLPNNLFPIIQRVAAHKLDSLKVFGGDYPTKDGTGVRDYIHVTDLALGHLAAMDKIEAATGSFYDIYNLGTGRGTSVLELIKLFEEASAMKIPYKITDRRPGDVAECYASVEKARIELGWIAKRTVKDACADAWRWQSRKR